MIGDSAFFEPTAAAHRHLSPYDISLLASLLLRPWRTFPPPPPQGLSPQQCGWTLGALSLPCCIPELWLSGLHATVDFEQEGPNSPEARNMGDLISGLGGALSESSVFPARGGMSGDREPNCRSVRFPAG